MRVLIGLIVALSMVVSCTDAPSSPSPSPGMDRSIRGVDFRNAMWFDYFRSLDPEVREDAATAEVQLRDGENKDNPARPYAIGEGPLFSDADGDRDEDAMVALRVADQGGLVAWYVWLWHDGRAVQARYPAVYMSRCEAAPTTIHTVGDGFEVRTALKRLNAPCAEAATQPVTYTVGVRQNYPARLRPEKGAPESCQRDNMIDAGSTGPLSPQVAADREAPVIHKNRTYDKVMYTPSQFGGRPIRQSGWTLALLVAGDEKFCGWLRD